MRAEEARVLLGLRPGFSQSEFEEAVRTSKDSCEVGSFPEGSEPHQQALARLRTLSQAAATLERALEEHRGDDPSRAAWLFRTTLAREPRPVELNRLVSFLEEEREARSQDPRRARTWATDPLGPLPSGLDPVEAAVWTSAAQLMLNLDEFLEPR